MIPETRGRKPKYDFTSILNSKESEFDFSTSLRISVMNFAKKNKVKIVTRKIGDKLKVYARR